MAIHDVKDPITGHLLARHVTAAEWEKGGLQFFSDDDHYMQVGVWGYDSGKRLLAHTHNIVPRTVQRTHETLYVRKGKIEARIFNEKREPMQTLIVQEGDLLTLMWGGHGYTILEDGTQVLEVKNGPYVGAELDRVRFES
jgi:hypothetical protein